LEHSKDVGELRGVAWGEAVGEYEVVFWGREGFELKVGDDTKGGTGASEGPEEVGVGGW
jgi:hypothetical protein